MVRPKKYYTEEERREARHQSYRKHYLAHREAIKAQQAERDRKKRAAIKAGPLHSKAGGAAVGRPRKYATEEERREAARQRNRKYYNANRMAIRARRAFKRKRAAIEVGQKVTSAGT